MTRHQPDPCPECGNDLETGPHIWDCSIARDEFNAEILRRWEARK